MGAETQNRAQPVEAKELKQATPEELKKIGEQAEKDSGKKRDLDDPAYVTALNKGWAEHYGDSHPLSKKVLEFSKENSAEAVQHIKDLQKQLKLDDDGIIGYKTIQAYNQYLEKNEKEGELGNNDELFNIDGSLGAIDALGKKEEQETLKTHGENLVQNSEVGTTSQDINGKTIIVEEENGEKVIMGTEGNSNRYYNPENGDYQSGEDFKKGRGEAKEKEAKEKVDNEGSIIKKKIDYGMVKSEEFGPVDGLDGKYEYRNTKDGFQRKSEGGNGTIETYNQGGGQWETEKQRIEGIKKEPVKIDDLEIKEGEWTELSSESTLEPGNGDGDRNPGRIQYFRDGDTVVRYDGKKLAYSMATRGEDGKVGEFQFSEYDSLPEGFRMKNAMIETQDFLTTYGDEDAAEGGIRGLKGSYFDSRVYRQKLGKLGKYADTFNQIRTENPDPITAGAIRTYHEKMKPLLEKYPEMANLTVEEYAKLRTDPESFAKSGIMKDRGAKIGQIIDPNNYGVKSEYKYVRANTDSIVKMPRVGDTNIDTVEISEKDGNFVSQREWLQGLGKNKDIKLGEQHPLPGSPNLTFIKDPNATYVYDTSKKEVIEVFKDNKWLALESHLDSTVSNS